jgi:hypothetical protein
VVPPEEQDTAVGVAVPGPEPDEPPVVATGVGVALPVPEEPGAAPPVLPVEAAGVVPLEELEELAGVLLLLLKARIGLEELAADAVLLEEVEETEELEELEELEDRDKAVGEAPLEAPEAPEDPEEPEEPEELEELPVDAAPPPPPASTLEVTVGLSLGAGTNFACADCCEPRIITAINKITAMTANSQFIKALALLGGSCIRVSIYAFKYYFSSIYNA